MRSSTETATKKSLLLVTIALLAVTASVRCLGQATEKSPTADNASEATGDKIPIMDGEAGPCSLELTVMAEAKPVAAANVKVHIAYGFVNAHRLNLEAYTNNQGKLKFIGLPSRVKRPLEFSAAKDNLSGIAVYDPKSECNAKQELTLVRQKEGQN